MQTTATFAELTADVDTLSYDELVEYRHRLHALRQEIETKQLALVAAMVDGRGRPATRAFLRGEFGWSDTAIQRALRDARRMARAKVKR